MAYFKVQSFHKARLLSAFLADIAGYNDLSPALRIKAFLSSAAEVFHVIFVYIAMLASSAAFAGARLFHAVVLCLRKTKIRRLNGAILMGMSAAVMLSATFIGLGLEVTVNGNSIGYVSSQKEFESAIVSAQNRVSDILGVPYKIDLKVGYRFDFVDRRKILDLNEVEEQLFTQVNDVKRMYVLRVDDEIVGANSSREVIDGVLQSMLAVYPIQDSADTVEFLRSVKITNELTDVHNALNSSELAGKLKSNQRDTVTYTAIESESVSSLAARNGLSEGELLAMNSAITEDTVPAGDEIVLKKAIPFLSVKYSDRQVYSEVIPYETEIINDDTMFKGERRTVTQGADGEAVITADFIFIDGEETEKNIVAVDVAEEAVNEVIHVGSKLRVATGSFMRPAAGKLTSNYGDRGRELHSGVDFAAPVGTKIIAADGGTVTFAGWKGNYGYCVIINHGNGVTTLYAHNSKLLVSAGQKVGKGETIARMGSTGRSTGSHCHFEVRINNKAVNPWNYIS